MSRLSAAAALGRGAANLRANRELVLVSIAGTIALVVLLVLSVLPWVATLGLDLDWSGGKSDPEKLLEFFRGLGSPAELVARASGLILSVLLALTLASFLYCWYFGGILGVLVAGDAQAPPGAGRAPALFRTFSARFFLHEAGRLLWRYLLYVSLFMAFWTVVVLVFAVAVGAAGALGGDAGFGTACAVGCGALLPILFVSFALLGAMSLGQADLARPESGVLRACAAGFRALSRRLGASAILLLILFCVSFAIALASSVIDMVGELALSGASEVVLKLLLFLVELLLGAMVNLWLTGAFVALFRDDAARNAAPPIRLGAQPVTA